jgi:hypothetical protein
MSFFVMDKERGYIWGFYEQEKSIDKGDEANLFLQY